MEDEQPTPGKRRARRTNLAKLAEHPDPAVVNAAKELQVLARLIEILAPFSPEMRERILRAAAAIKGVWL